MFELDPSLKKIDTTPEKVIAIITSLNTPDVMTDLPKPEPTQAYIISTQGAGGAFGMFIYLFHQATNVPRIYAWKGDPISRSNFSNVEAAALEFTESMGFLMDNSHYRKKPPEERAEFYKAIPCFKADLSEYVKAQEEKVDHSLIDLTEDITEIDEEAGKEAAPAGEEEGTGEVVEVEELETVDVEDAAGEAEVLEAAEAGAKVDPVVEPTLDVQNPFGEMVVESPGASVPDNNDLKNMLDSLEGELGDAKPQAGGISADFFDEKPAAQKGADLAQDIDATIDKMIREEKEEIPPAEESAVDSDDLDLDAHIPEPPPPVEEFDVELPDQEAAVSKAAEAKPPVAAKAPAPSVADDGALDIELEEPPASKAAKAAPAPAPPAAPAPSLEDEILAAPEPPVKTIPPQETPAPPVDEAALKQKIERIGRFLASW
ncbi:MAG: hypothetical protein AB1405_14975 [Bdellovibrionota bacterium]